MLATYWQNVKKVGKCVVNITNNSKMSDTFHRYRIESCGHFAYVEFTTKVQTKMHVLLYGSFLSPLGCKKYITQRKK